MVLSPCRRHHAVLPALLLNVVASSFMLNIVCFIITLAAALVQPSPRHPPLSALSCALRRPPSAISTMSGPGRPPSPRRQPCNGKLVPPDANHVPEAGLRSLDHYRKALPPWRYAIRHKMLPLIRCETPYLAGMQQTLRTPALDSYFAITANLGTHTFFMVGLPIIFWCGYASFGKGLVHILALGVFWTGFVKDFLSLPRPLSPPLHRITMSGSAALEYGFPSTHSANAVSVAVYALLHLHSPASTLSEPTKLLLEALCYFYAASIVFGRLYCGMHGFLDVAVGSLFGVAIGWLEFTYGPCLNHHLYSSSWLVPLLVSIAIVVFVGLHPEPADDCPCFDDSVAFAGVLIGLEFGTWTYSKSSGGATGPDSIPLGLALNVARIVLGVLVIFAWRETMKPTLLKLLPHLFRWMEHLGWSLPRRFFTPATEYKSVPTGSRLDTLFPAASDFPRMVQGIRHPTTRGRSVSIGPQSAADAYETLAYRELRRRESVATGVSDDGTGDDELFGSARRDRDCSGRDAQSSAVQRHSLARHDHETMVNGSPASHVAEARLEEKQMFSLLVRPRVRYDVEVVTKLVIYAGIAGLATAVIPHVFALVGLDA
ncbi:hypothetical protein CDD82_35 [Ophiocordyceps australis]|uniref:Phosphatidic acid phosphatase type 2/haloperoxidase domain-containing protein n=1 Tax=Ophiocordyceps australis TaxID=1399860 RepID=A0A2C5ZVI1_9HYPO|nr:hypothetical protein CDD82_35 [Ophiocordyceps australis]